MRALAAAVALALLAAACATPPPPPAEADDKNPVGRSDPKYVADAAPPPAALP